MTRPCGFSHAARHGSPLRGRFRPQPMGQGKPGSAADNRSFIGASLGRDVPGRPPGSHTTWLSGRRPVWFIRPAQRRSWGSVVLRSFDPTDEFAATPPQPTCRSPGESARVVFTRVWAEICECPVAPLKRLAMRGCWAFPPASRTRPTHRAEPLLPWTSDLFQVFGRLLTSLSALGRAATMHSPPSAGRSGSPAGRAARTRQLHPLSSFARDGLLHSVLRNDRLSRPRQPSTRADAPIARRTPDECDAPRTTPCMRFRAGNGDDRRRRSLIGTRF